MVLNRAHQVCNPKWYRVQKMCTPYDIGVQLVCNSGFYRVHQVYLGWYWEQQGCNLDSTGYARCVPQMV
jgi:hypothetical protein